MTVIIFSHNLVGRLTHYWNRRTRPCTGSGCAACQDNNRARWNFWCAGQERKTKERVILEVTRDVAFIVGEFFDAHRTLRGAEITVWRKNAKPNGQVVAKMEEGMCGSETIPKGPDLRPILERLWEIKDLTLLEPAVQLKPRLAPTGTEGDHLD